MEVGYHRQMLYKKVDRANHEKQVSKQYPFMASALVAASMFLP